MSKLPFSFACTLYDRMEALWSGAVRMEGVDLDYRVFPRPREIFDRMAEHQEFDAAEFSSSQYITGVARGDSPFVAIPVFPSKMFRHSFMFYNKRSGIKGPKDFAGKRIGMPLYTQTAAIWCRGHLMHDYGVDLSDVHWVQGAVNAAGKHGTEFGIPKISKPVDLVHAPLDRSLSDMLSDGEIDAMIGSTRPDCLRTNPDVVRLFPDYRRVEREFFQETGICPIMHVVAIKKETYERHPWVAESLFKACQESKAWALKMMRFTGAQRYMVPWLSHAVDEIDEVFDGDPWSYGLEKNRATLEALVLYLKEQNMIPEIIPLDELFVPMHGVHE